MSGEEGFDAWMAQLEARAFTSVDEAAATMVELLVRTNREIEIEVREPGTTGPGWERLREIIRKAVELIRKIAQEFGGGQLLDRGQHDRWPGGLRRMELRVASGSGSDAVSREGR